MWRRAFLLLACYWVMMLCQYITITQASNNVSVILPPVGNSLQAKLKTKNALRIYTCGSGGWTSVNASGDLLDFNTSKLVGSFTAVRFPISQTNITLLNSDADVAESGFLTSSVIAVKIASINVTSIFVPETLNQATSHQNIGAAGRVSYVVYLNFSGGNPPPTSLCTLEFGILESISVEVPQDVEIDIYTQDLVPPPTPKSLTVPNGTSAESFFAQGSIIYQYNGSTWLEQNISALLYNVIGGHVVGKFEYLQKPDKFGSKLNWHIYNPYGFSLTGHNFVNPIVLSTTDVPWALFKITSSSGNTTLLGPYTYVQLVSTRGGTAPSLSDSVGLPPGLVWTSPFSGIFWFYANST
ncbi:hypothetical protein CY35_13G028000 [Sphagnum magellanicum]|nr:hypothetical protein CY35_13G028000 [Sphagnum magellanicum]